MHAAFSFGLWHALHAVGATFVVQIAIDAVAFKGQRDLGEAATIGRAGLHDLALPAFFLGVVLVHLIQVLGEQRGFFATGTGANFHHAASAVGIFAADGHVEQLAP